MILFGVLLGVGGGGLGSFYPKNVETALDTLINTKTGMKSINIQPDIENINTTLPDNFTACATSCPAAECRERTPQEECPHHCTSYAKGNIPDVLSVKNFFTIEKVDELKLKFLKIWPLAINEIIHVIRRSRSCVLLDSAIKRNA